MSQRSKVVQLPEEIQAELDAMLVKSGFSGYAKLEAWLKAKGFEIGKSSIHRYGEELEEVLADIKVSTRGAAAIAAAAPDDPDLRSAAVISMVQTELFNTMVKMRQAARETTPAKRMKLLTAAAGNIAKLSRASVNQKKWEIEQRGRVKAAAEKATKIAKKGGLTADAVDTIRREILGIAA